LDPAKAAGKIVTCLRGINPRYEKGEVVKAAGGVGMVIAGSNETGNSTTWDPFNLPALTITYDDGNKVFSYINSTA
jgi:hypothetical protein